MNVVHILVAVMVNLHQKSSSLVQVIQFMVVNVIRMSSTHVWHTNVLGILNLLGIHNSLRLPQLNFAEQKFFDLFLTFFSHSFPHHSTYIVAFSLHIS